LKILLVANYPIDRQVSMQRFARMLEAGLCAAGLDVTVIAPRAVLFPRVQRATGIWKWVGYVNKFLIFPWALRRAARQADVVHVCDHSNAPYAFALRRIPHVITCHDVIAIRAARGLEPGERVGAPGRLFQAAILSGLRAAARIVCDSTCTRDQLLELAPELDVRSQVVDLGLNMPLHPVAEANRAPLLRDLGLDGVRYFLHVGSALPRKNRAGAVAIFAELLRLRPDLPHRLVFVGAPLGPDVAPAIAALGVGERVVGLGAVSAEALGALYSGAEALLYPSWSEGFGWPVIEAQACACAVFASRRRPMTDLGHDGAEYFDPADPAGAARHIAACIASLPDLRERGLANVRRFDTPRMIERYMAVYRELLAAGGCLHLDGARPGIGNA